MIEYYDKEELELQISNYLSGNSTDEEKETLLAFLASNEAAARTFHVYCFSTLISCNIS